MSRQRLVIGWAVVLAVVTVAWGIGGCRKAPAHSVDLVARMQWADAAAETARIDIGLPQAQPFLVTGFRPLKAGGGAARESVGPASELAFDLVKPRPLRLTLVGSALASARAQTVEVSINDTSLGPLRLAATAAEHGFSVPGELLVAGRNRLRLSYPKQGFTEGGAVWQSLHISGAYAFGAPDVEDNPPALVLPYGSQLQYPVEAAGATVLVADDLVPWGTAAGRGTPGHLEVEWEPADGASETRRVPIEKGRLELTLPTTATPFRLTLRVVPGREAPGAPAGVRLIRPRLLNADIPHASRSMAAAAPKQTCIPSPAQPPNVVLYVVDTLRADHLGVYGYPKPTSPEIDAFARRAATFLRCTAQAPYTKPAMASILSGLPPPIHLVTNTQSALPAPAVTIAEKLRDRGYATAGFVTNPALRVECGYARGFDDYTMLSVASDEASVGVPRSHKVNEAALEWLGRRPAGRPFFLYLHTMDPHSPYTPENPYRESFAPHVPVTLGYNRNLNALKQGKLEATEKMRHDLLALYDAEIAENDASFGRLVHELESQGLLDETLVIFTADHGEEFYDRGGWEHGHTLHEELVQVPLIVKFPGGAAAGRRIAGLSQQIDVMPTVLGLINEPAPPGAQGADLREIACGAPRAEPMFSHVGDQTSVTSERFKLIYRAGDDRGLAPSRRLFDLAADPHEMTRHRDAAAGLALHLDAQRRAYTASLSPLQMPKKNVPVDPETQERIRALGYVD